MPEKILVKDASGKLYAVPQDVLEAHSLDYSAARDLINTDSRREQAAKLEKLGIVQQVDGANLPNFLILMQTEYRGDPLPKS